ncbi:MAG: hypothetical protein ACR2OX_12765 [Methyloligellaceae bacterium]
MKRQKHKGRNLKKKNRNKPTGVEISEETPTRRAFLGKIRNGAIATLVVGSGSWLLVDKVRATMREKDFSQIGNGIPTVVQIHDPQCPKCVALQRETRDALCEFDDTQLQFVVANIRTAEGRQLATTHRVSNVTLLLFDAAGRRQSVLSGPNKSEYLTGAFRRHVARFGNS